MTRLHLVNGFLGSGKTTAIIEAARRHVLRGERVGVVTNDQGRYLVDTAFVSAQDIPVVQVTGGCFCCSYDQLLEVLTALHEDAQPQVIYAESVGSCADLIATVVRPLQGTPGRAVRCQSLSVFADSRLLLHLLRGDTLPLGDDVLYIIERQLAEAGLVVLNKWDLLHPQHRKELLSLAADAFAGVPLLPQNSLLPEEIARWMEAIEGEEPALPSAAVWVDYARYGRGETQLAWIDRALLARLPDQGRSEVVRLLQAISEALEAHQVPVAHVKWHLSSETGTSKLSWTTLSQPDWASAVPAVSGTTQLLLNARIQADSAQAGAWIDEALARALAASQAGWRIVAQETFAPSPPQRPARALP